MRWRTTATVVFLALAGWAADASALTGWASGHCEDGRHLVTAGGDYDAGTDGDIVGIVFLRQAIGACLPDEEVPAAPVVLDVFDSADHPGQEFRATASVPAPAIDVVYRYVALAVRTDGTREAVGFAGWGFPPRTLVSCREAPFLRGTIALDPVFSSPGHPWYTFPPVADGCWTEELFNVGYTADALVSMLGGTMAQLLGQEVDVYGTIAAHDLVPPASHWITRVELVDPSVPAVANTWSGLKARYR